jgi:type III pantothenate kinase
MSMLLVDIGNTRIKWARAEAAGPGAAHAAVHARWTPAHYRRLLARGVTGVLAASVAGTRVDQALARAAAAAGVGIRFVRVPRRGGGVTTGYAEPWRLGVDRYIGMVGAHHLFRGVALCVVGVGTAMTLDLLGARGRHWGGAIIPAPALMVHTLLAGTSGIRRRAQGGAAGDKGLFARSTRAGVAQGARYAAAALIDRAVEEAMIPLGARALVVITGGEAQEVRPLLRSHCVGVADLTLRGLWVLAQGGASSRAR